MDRNRVYYISALINDSDCLPQSPDGMPASLILASQSPRRKQLLRILGPSFDVISADIVETVSNTENPEEVVVRLAREKAAVVSENHPDAVVIGADTIVVLDDEILGKPASRAEAISMLKLLSDRSHTVLTGVSLQHKTTGQNILFAESTRVEFGPLKESEIQAYLDTGSSFDKAGGYGIQDDGGALFVKGIDGDYFNVMGLPIYRLNLMLRKHFPSLFHYD